MPTLDELEDRSNVKSLPWIVALSQIIGIGMVATIIIWLNHFLGGFAWDGTSKEFNLHILCMVFGIIFLYGEGTLVYRIFRSNSKLKMKLIHASLLFLAMPAIIVGLIVAFRFHKFNDIPNMYSLHSWCGMATVLLFCIQFLIGFYNFLLPGTSRIARKFYLPIHKYFGSAILTLAGVTAVAGINEFLPSIPTSQNLKKSLPPVALMGNFGGLAILSFIICVLFIIHNPNWEIKSSSEEEALSMHFAPLNTENGDEE